MHERVQTVKEEGIPWIMVKIDNCEQSYSILSPGWIKGMEDT